MLEGTRAELVLQPVNGTRAIEPMLVVTRMWNSVCAVASMRRGLALARSYAAQRIAFGQPLANQPLHADTLASTAALSHQAPTLRQVLRRRTKGIPARCLPFTPRAS